MTQHYTLSADYYDALYEWKDYGKESKTILKMIQKNQKSKGKDLLEVGCGTGKYLEHFTKQFHCTGVDLSHDMLNVCRKKFPKMTLHKMDMRKLRLKKKYDVILCLFSSIGYVKTYDQLERTINGFASHLKEGGVLIIEPWFAPANYHPGKPSGVLYKSSKLVVARVTVSEKKENLSVMDMHHLIAEKGKKVRHVIEHHELGLFTPPKTLKIIERTGIKARFNPKGISRGRGLFIGTKPLA